MIKGSDEFVVLEKGESKNENTVSSDSSEYDSEDELEIICDVEELINIAKPIGDTYVLTVDDQFLCSVKTEEEAERLLKFMGNKYKRDCFEPGYNVYISQIDKYTIQVERSYSCFLISYEEVIKTISYYKVKMVEMVKED